MREPLEMGPVNPRLNECSYYFQCPVSKTCANNQCFWKQRDCFGREVWVNLLTFEKDKESDSKIVETYGEPYFPEWQVSTGTNCMYLSCKDFKPLEESTLS